MADLRTAAQWLGLTDEVVSRRYKWTTTMVNLGLGVGGYLLFGFWGFLGGLLLGGLAAMGAELLLRK